MPWKEKHAMTAEEREVHEKKWGRYNDFPPGWRKITQEQFAQSLFFTFAPEIVEHRQMLTRNDDGFTVNMTEAWLFFSHENIGYGMVRDFWAGKVMYYAFGCNHPHPNRYTCPKCGFHADYDTSD